MYPVDSLPLIFIKRAHSDTECAGGQRMHWRPSKLPHRCTSVSRILYEGRAFSVAKNPACMKCFTAPRHGSAEAMFTPDPARQIRRCSAASRRLREEVPIESHQISVSSHIGLPLCQVSPTRAERSALAREPCTRAFSAGKAASTLNPDPAKPLVLLSSSTGKLA